MAAMLQFTNQKNAVRGEQIGHRANNHEWFCPAKALGCIVHRLHLHRAAADTLLCRHCNEAKGTWCNVKSAHITNSLQHAARILQPKASIAWELVTTRSLCLGGAATLLCGNVDDNNVRLLGCWKSDAMFCYLCAQALASTHNFAQVMLDHGHCTFTPGTTDLPDVLPIEVPADFAHLLDAPDLLGD